MSIVRYSLELFDIYNEHIDHLIVSNPNSNNVNYENQIRENLFNKIFLNTVSFGQLILNNNQGQFQYT